MKTFRTRTVHFVFSLRIFVSVQVVITSITAPGMFTKLSIGSSVTICRLVCSEISLSVTEKKLEKSPGKGRTLLTVGSCFSVHYRVMEHVGSLESTKEA